MTNIQIQYTGIYLLGLIIMSEAFKLVTFHRRLLNPLILGTCPRTHAALSPLIYSIHTVYTFP